MHSSFQKLFATIELQRNKTLATLIKLTDDQFNSAPQGKWTIAQILSHLVAGEKMSIQYIRKKIQGVKDLPDSGIREEVKMSLLKLSQRLPGLKFRAPKQLVEGTQQFKDLKSLKDEWDAVREDLRILLETIPAEYVNRKIYRHVRVGYLNMKHAIMFFGEHVTHHTPQIKKLL